MFDLNHTHIEKEVVEIQANKGVVGKKFKGDAKIIYELLKKLSPDEINGIEKILEEG